ncbi:hypothetical protein X777_00357 [Ooceraea biroi]|uniref:Uncharacterized protein n=1 Tax=Ooceraea biroi TaxID=2015173 RepID=A0A026WWK9_OOCBI|nr:hypothetical protein X777_00357 [Ooceraea biroi]
MRSCHRPTVQGYDNEGDGGSAHGDDEKYKEEEEEKDGRRRRRRETEEEKGGDDAAATGREGESVVADAPKWRKRERRSRSHRRRAKRPASSRPSSRPGHYDCQANANGLCIINGPRATTGHGSHDTRKRDVNPPLKAIVLFLATAAVQFKAQTR